MSFLLSSQLTPHFPHTADDIPPQRENSNYQKRMFPMSSHPADKLIHAHMDDFHFPSHYHLRQTVPTYASDLSPSDTFRNSALSKSSGVLPLHQIFLLWWATALGVAKSRTQLSIMETWLPWRRTRCSLSSQPYHKAQHSENEDHGIWSYHFMANRWGNSRNNGWLYFSRLQNHMPMVIATMKLKDAYSLEGVMTNLGSILKSRDISLPTMVCLVKAMVFSSSYV